VRAEEAKRVAEEKAKEEAKAQTQARKKLRARLRKAHARTPLAPAEITEEFFDLVLANADPDGLSAVGAALDAGSGSSGEARAAELMLELVRVAIIALYPSYTPETTPPIPCG
jgi:hypothetical protein